MKLLKITKKNKRETIKVSIIKLKKLQIDLMWLGSRRRSLTLKVGQNFGPTLDSSSSPRG